MKPRLFIVDDEAPARSRLMTLLADLAEDCPHEIVGEADSGPAALEGIALHKPDIILLDVQMPGMTGIELARLLASHAHPAPAIIFITAYDDYALKAFEVHALDYLLKPVRAARLAQAIQRAAGMRAATVAHGQGARKHFSVQERGRMLLVPVADVLYLKAEQKYVTLRTRSRDYLIEETLSSIEGELADIFVRVHRNALVARDAIAGVEREQSDGGNEAGGERGADGWQVIVREIEERLPISRRQWSVVKALVR